MQAFEQLLSCPLETSSAQNLEFVTMWTWNGDCFQAVSQACSGLDVGRNVLLLVTSYVMQDVPPSSIVYNLQNETDYDDVAFEIAIRLQRSMWQRA